MSMTLLKNRLQAAMRLWSHGRESGDLTGQAGYIPGVLRGLREALALLQTERAEEVRKALAIRRSFTRASAAMLYNACHQAYDRLRRSDRLSAMRVLERALMKADATRPRPRARQKNTAE